MRLSEKAASFLCFYCSNIGNKSSDASGNLTFQNFGLAGDIALTGDYDGDGKADSAVYRGGMWYVLNSSTNTDSCYTFGLATDLPVVGR